MRSFNIFVLSLVVFGAMSAWAKQKEVIVYDPGFESHRYLSPEERDRDLLIRIIRLEEKVEVLQDWIANQTLDEDRD